MQDAALRSLLRDLQGLRFDREEKASDLEILVDYLELVAVASGEKPAHLQGQGMRSRSFMLRGTTLASLNGNGSATEKRERKKDTCCGCIVIATWNPRSRWRP